MVSTIQNVFEHDRAQFLWHTGGGGGWGGQADGRLPHVAAIWRKRPGGGDQ